MATQNINYRNEHAFDERLSTLRSTLRTMLNEVTAKTQPVSIDPDRGCGAIVAPAFERRYRTRIKRVMRIYANHFNPI